MSVLHIHIHVTGLSIQNIQKERNIDIMGASSSGLLDEAKICNIKELTDSAFQKFSMLYRQQYAAAYFRHLHQEVEPKKEGRGLLLTHRSQYNQEEVLYQGCVKFSCWDEQGKKCKEKYIVLRRDYTVGIHENIEAFNRGCDAKLILQTAGGSVFTTEEEARAHLEQTCAVILSEVKEDSQSSASPPDVFAVYLHLPYSGHTFFQFKQEEERDHFLSAIETCIRHCNIDPWCDLSYESQAYIRALQLYRQDKGSYEYWEMLMGTEEKVLATQVMEEVLPWLQSQLQPRLKGKKTERIRQSLTTVHATHTLVLEQLTASLEALREECRQKASANQALIRSDLDQIMSSHCFLEEKVRACICEEAEKVCSESVAPYMSSILEVLTENISAGIQGIRHTLHTQMDSAFTQTNGGTGDTVKALSTLRSINLDDCYRQVENLTKKLEDLKQRFGLNSTQRLVHSTHMEMEKLLDSAVYTLELFLQSSARLQPSQIPVKMERAKERVLKQLDYDSRVVQRRLYQDTLLEITLPALTRRIDSKWKNELKQFEQHIFSDYSSFILVQNVYDDVLRNILSKEIETAVKETASTKSNHLLLDTSDLAISQYSLLGQTPPRSAPGSPSIHARDSTSAAPSKEAAPVVKEEGQTVITNICPQSDQNLNADVKSDPSVTQSCDTSTMPLSPVIVVTQQIDELSTVEASGLNTTGEEVQLGTDAPSAAYESDAGHEVSKPVAPADQESINLIQDSPNLSMSTLSSSESTDVPPEECAQIDQSATLEESVSTSSSSESTDVPLVQCAQSDQSSTPESSATPGLSTSDQETGDPTSVQQPPPSSAVQPCADSSMKIILGSLSEVIGCNPAATFTEIAAQQSTDRAVYLTGEIKDNWELERLEREKQIEATEEKETCEKTKEGQEEVEAVEGKEEKIEGKRDEGQIEDLAQTGQKPISEGCQSSECPAESAIIFTTEQSEEKADNEGKGSELVTEKKIEDEEKAEKRGDDAENKGNEKKEEEVLQIAQPVESEYESVAERPLDSVAIIRELVTEITEVDTVVSPCPNGSQTPH